MATLADLQGLSEQFPRQGAGVPRELHREVPPELFLGHLVSARPDGRLPEHRQRRRLERVRGVHPRIDNFLDVRVLRAVLPIALGDSRARPQGHDGLYPDPPGRLAVLGVDAAVQLRPTGIFHRWRHPSDLRSDAVRPRNIDRAVGELRRVGRLFRRDLLRVQSLLNDLEHLVRARRQLMGFERDGFGRHTVPRRYFQCRNPARDDLHSAARVSVYDPRTAARPWVRHRHDRARCRLGVHLSRLRTLVLEVRTAVLYQRKLLEPESGLRSDRLPSRARSESRTRRERFQADEERDLSA